MALFRNSQVDKIADAESDLELAQMSTGRGHEVMVARGRVVKARNEASFAENMQADYEVATGDRNSREPFSGKRGLFS